MDEYAKAYGNTFNTVEFVLWAAALYEEQINTRFALPSDVFFT